MSKKWSKSEDALGPQNIGPSIVSELYALKDACMQVVMCLDCFPRNQSKTFI